MQDQVTKCVLRIMKNKSVTQAQLADALNCSQTAVSNILSGKTRLTVDDLAKIALTLQVAPEELLGEAAQQARVSVQLSNEAEQYIVSNRLAFYLLNLLKKPVPSRDLFAQFAPRYQTELKAHLSKFLEFNLVTEDISGNLRLNFPEPSILHYRLGEAYARRISEIYSELRPIVNDVANSDEKSIKAWKQRNLDSFYIEFFTEDQIKEQNQLMRQTLDIVKHHIRMNRHEANRSGLNDRTELRVLYLVSAPCPAIDPNPAGVPDAQP